jgi:hypothetical protein
MRSNFLLSIFGIILLTLTSSCSCFFDYKFEVVNETSTAITFKYQTGGDLYVLDLNPNERKDLMVTDGFRCNCSDCKGSRINAVDSTMNIIMSEITVLRNGIASQTDFNYEHKWDFESKKKLGLYTAYIKDSDF